MNFSQIKCFLAASECLNFTKAAERLYLSQPVLSRQIAAMEDELGIELFIREKKTVRLTAAGEVMAEGLRKLAGDYSDLVEKASALHKGFAGTLNIGIYNYESVNSDWCCFDNFRLTYLGPDTRVSSVKQGTGRWPHDIYNLHGQRVSKPGKGVYIVGGKKMKRLNQ